ncbi:MAG: sugar kinase, partial [Chloroflexota bacterium]
MSRVVTFGEIMLRLSPPAHLRFVQAQKFDAIYGGGESNVAVSLTHFGIKTNYVTRLPKNDIGQACLNYLRQYGVGTDYIVHGGDRLGIYFLEHGAVSRGSKVVYDRAGSALSTIESGMIDWDSVFEGAEWCHWTGITPAISEGAAKVCLEAVRAAKQHGLTVSADLNYRKKLWKWGKQPGEVMEEMVALCDVVIGNEEDSEKVFDIHPPESDVTSGKLDAEKYRFVCEKLSEKFPNLKTIAITLRGSISASHNSWSAV